MTQLFNGHAKAVFFDLDGTLVDTAPDMVAALQELQVAHGVDPVRYEFGRSHVSNGALGLLRIAFPDATISPDSLLLCEFIERYAAQVCVKSNLFAGLEILLEQLDSASLPWGVVTNKPAHLTNPIMAALGLSARSVCTISGDTLPSRKPDPAQLLHACEISAVAPAECIYVGDAARDIEAGSRAGMATIAATYGYIVSSDDPQNWGADEYAGDPGELAQILLKAVNLPAR
ncbi:MAG: HAD-IA family hydrolase [Proteobacteria bacterium]|nr:HAD-IA family hydrolase [Pseudomonadota bacterium]MDA1064734.1 HAD-IA family hydrolase [Pseudomonadota bacterium]